MNKEEVKIFTDEVLTVPDLVKRFNVTPHTVCRWMENQGLPYVKVGHKRMTTVPVFEKWTQREED
tara:strand:- start:2678 stop:2872 length:195 start_codon:yes stop_codon:yes gene_type:complete